MSFLLKPTKLQAVMSSAARRHASACAGGCGTSQPIESLLGLEPGTPPDALRKAFLERAKALHPDLGGSNEAFVKLQAAWEARDSQSCSLSGFKGGLRLRRSTTEVLRFAIRVSDAAWIMAQQEILTLAVQRAAVASSTSAARPDVPPPRVRRISERCENVLSLELEAHSPRHRDSLADGIGRFSGRPFLAQLRDSFAAAGGPESISLRLESQVRWHTAAGGAAAVVDAGRLAEGGRGEDSVGPRDA